MNGNQAQVELATKGKARSDALGITRSNRLILTESATTLPAFLGQNVTFTGAAAKQLAGAGLFKPLGDGLSCFLHKTKGKNQEYNQFPPHL